MADHEERSSRKRTRDDDDEASTKDAEALRSRDLKWLREMMEEEYGRHRPLWEKAFGTKTSDLIMRKHGMVDRDQAHVDGEEKAAHGLGNAHCLTMGKTHDQQGGAGNQAAKEEQERPTQTPTSADGARAPSPDRQPLDTDLSEAVAEENEEQVNLDVGREVVGYQAGLPSHEEQVDDSTGGIDINSSHGEGLKDSEVEEARAIGRQEGELVPICTKTRTKTTTTRTTTKKNGTTITTVTKTSTKVSRKRFERR